jgi:hypothetical protein
MISLSHVKRRSGYAFSPKSDKGISKKFWYFLKFKIFNHEFIQILEGLEINGQFGFAMESVDINQDGFDDLIISAPFVENGKIYIFNGKPIPDDVLEIFDQIPSQTISQFESNWFGHSLSVNADLDDNQYSDIVVGMG